MADNLGPGVSRVLDPQKAQITQVVWQQGRPPLDSELNLLQQLATDWRKSLVLRGTPSGWLGNGSNDLEAYMTNATWSNWFRFGQQRTGEEAAIQWAVVNGWLIPVTGTLTGTPPGSPNNTDNWNRVTLNPPPSSSGSSRVDYVFLEVWQALVPPNPSSTNKPSASGLYRYGNKEGGYSFLTDDLVDPNIGFETTQRVQIQYRIRVVSGVIGLTSFPDGFDPANVKARGAAASDTAFTFENMREALGDSGLWRAGDGTPNTLGTVDGYSYAVPLAAVFRRNSVAWDGDPGQNLNGGFNRNPTAVDRSGWKTFSTVPSLSADMNDTQLTLTLSSTTNLPLPVAPSTDVTIRVGDEIMTYTSITGSTMTLSARGVLGSKAEIHFSGDVILVESGRPDGLFADQIAKSDILDLRHLVNPNGFDYDSLLQGALDKLMKGDLKANWKRSGGGPQGTTVTYQDKVSSSAAALGIAKLDSPDGIRHIWSDASVLQPIEFIATPPVGTTSTEDIDTAWGLGLAGTMNNTGGSANRFSPSKVITIPIDQFKLTVPGSDSDQVQFPAIDASDFPVVRLRLGRSRTFLVEGTDYTVATPTGPDDDLVITLLSTFNGSATSELNETLYITFHVQYGAGRGMSKRPDRIHSVAYLNAASGTILRSQGIPANNIPISVAYAPLWSKFRKGVFNGQVPATAESYIDPGSRTVVLSPFRQIALPGSSTAVYAYKDNNVNGASVGVMPVADWPGTPDPLELFSTGADPTSAKQNTFVVIPRKLMPGWGSVYAPVVAEDTGTLVEGINFGFDAPKGNFSAGTHPLNNFIPFAGGNKSFASFSTILLDTVGGADSPHPYNEKNSTLVQGTATAGMRFFDDTRGLGRRGLELPPYYGIVRLWAIYEAEDFFDNGSAYNDSTREIGGSGATNLLRQNIDGPSFWIEITEDGDSTFVVNAELIDLAKSPNALATFEDGNYVIEASIFGFDRGAFDLDSECRIVLARSRPSALNPAGGGASAQVNTSSVQMVIPAPPQGADSVGINYSRTPYMGDCWGSQNSMQDILQLVGPLTSADAHQIGYTEIDEEALSRPNPKVVEVLASQGFMTTLGTGRISGDYDTDELLDWRLPGYEATAAYPPTTTIADRPVYQSSADVFDDKDALLNLGTTFSGVTERLPLGSLFRDKDFRGGAIPGAQEALGLVFRSPGKGVAGGLIQTDNSEQREVPVYTATTASGGPGEILVHHDGESGNLSLLANYRTTRGGSAFVASGPHPGGELAGQFGHLQENESCNAVLCGIAYLVRNTVTNIGATEVSAGGELMMLIVTTAIRENVTVPVPAFVLCGTNGSAEGFSAADLYRIPGHPLVNDHVRLNITPTSIALSNKVSYKPRLGG